MWVSLFLSLILFIPLPFLVGNTKLRRKYIYFFTHHWATMILRSTGSRIIISGLENIPSDRNFVVVSNHQGNMDIPVIMHSFPLTLSFMAKKELAFFPFFNIWILIMQCVFIDRKKVFRSKRVIEERLAAKDKNPLLIFPEGTRSQSEKPGKFKTGGLHLIYKSEKNILPLVISGTYLAWEKYKKISPAKIHITILPLIPNPEMHNLEFRKFVEMLENRINKELEA